MIAEAADERSTESASRREGCRGKGDGAGLSLVRPLGCAVGALPQPSCSLEMEVPVMTQNFDEHAHEEMVHDHDHIHITHHDAGGEHRSIDHLVATHSHVHTHTHHTKT